MAAGFSVGTTFINSRAVESIEHLGNGWATIHFKDGEKLTGILRKAARVVPSPRSEIRQPAA